VRPGRVWIAEDFDREEFGFLTGLFSAHWEGPDDQRKQGPRSVPVEEALAWGRGRADVVLIRSGESNYFSAGVRQPEGEKLPEWPADARFSRRRAPSAAYLDRTSADDPILWQVSLQASLPVSHLGAFPVAFNQAVAADERVIDPILYADPTPQDADITDYSHLAADTKVVNARFKLSARTWKQASDLAGGIGNAAFKNARHNLGDWPEGATWSLSIGAVPADD
jgi:hypothetical protein